MANNRTNKSDLFTLRGKERLNIICIVVKHNSLFRGGLMEGWRKGKFPFFPASFDCILSHKASSDIFSRFGQRAYGIYQIWTHDIESLAQTFDPESSDRPSCNTEDPTPSERHRAWQLCLCPGFSSLTSSSVLPSESAQGASVFLVLMVLFSSHILQVHLWRACTVYSVSVGRHVL